MATQMPSLPAAVDTETWSLYERRSEPVVRLPTTEVTAHTVVYEDARLRSVVREATGGCLDRVWRFFFATRLTISPPPPPGVGTASWYPTIAAEARDGFTADLRERGFERVERHRGQRMRTTAGKRARLTKLTAEYPVEWDGRVARLPTEGWLAVRTDGREFRLTGGAYPTDFTGALREGERAALSADPSEYRNDLLDLIRGVE